jgi:hypothetical protein
MEMPLMLRPDAKRPWVWTNDAWKPSSPGTFAVIIGVSDYAYLDGSSAHFGLDKLFVSALTAFRFFEWLVSAYRWTDCPVAKCWLLLAPTAAELGVVPSMGQHAIFPDYSSCEQAIQEWNAEMSSLPPSVAKGSRSVFFFSGHGLEILPERQVLLPLDYFKPHSSLDRALSTQNLSRALRALQVPLHFLFLDACRNDHNNLNRYEPLEGTKILTEPSSRSVNPDAFVPIFYGSASGTQAFQPSDPALGLSLFGEALLDGLFAKGLMPVHKGNVYLIDLHGLRPFVESRIAQIVSSRYKQAITQRARVRGDQTEEGVTEVSPPPGGVPLSPPLPQDLLKTTFLPIQMLALESVRPTADSPARVHDFFGSEKITQIWTQRTRIFDYGAGSWLDPGADIEISGLRRAPDSTGFEFDLRIPSAKRNRTYWLQLQDEAQTVGCVLPIDQDPDTQFRFELEFALEPRAVTRLDVTLSPENTGELGLAAKLWIASNESASRDVFDPENPLLRVSETFQKTSFPLTALIAASVLLRYRRWDTVTAWLRDIPSFVPDAAVLQAERCLRNPTHEDATPEALRYFLTLDGKSLPSLADASGYALQQSELFRDMELPAKEQLAVERIHARLVKALGIFRAGGLFATFAGPSERVSPAIITASALAQSATNAATRAGAA